MIQKFFKWAAINFFILYGLPCTLTTIKLRYRAGREYREKIFILER